MHKAKSATGRAGRDQARVAVGRLGTEILLAYQGIVCVLSKMHMLKSLAPSDK